MRIEDVGKRGEVQGSVIDLVFPCLSHAHYIPLSCLRDFKKYGTEAKSHGPNTPQPESVPLNSFPCFLIFLVYEFISSPGVFKVCTHFMDKEMQMFCN